jgi:predicted acyl esterase
VPTLTVGGYYDQEDMYGPQIEYATLEPHDANHQNFLVLGPWRHGSWSQSFAPLGQLDYTEPIGKEYRAQIEAKFFAHYLKETRAPPASTSKTRPAFRPARTPGSATRTFRLPSRSPPACILPGAACSVGASSTTEAKRAT